MQHPYMVCLENLSKLVKHFVELKHDWKAREIRCLLVLDQSTRVGTKGLA